MKELRRLLLITAATAGLALSLTGCSKNVDFLQYADVTFDGINGKQQQLSMLTITKSEPMFSTKAKLRRIWMKLARKRP